MTPLEQARAIANTVLYEGYLLFPYTRSSLKNQSPYQFGVLMPHGYTDTSEPVSMEFVILSLAKNSELSDGMQRVEILARFLHQSDGDATEREVPLQVDLNEGTHSMKFAFGDLHGTLSCTCANDGGYVRLAVRLQNDTVIPSTADRNNALRHAMIGAHALATIDGGEFISLLDPPEDAKFAVANCKNRRVFPVLAGEPDGNEQSGTIVLASPIILYDFPKVSPQSAGHTYDATEIDELLMLSVASLSDDEKREAREGDERARAIVDRAEFRPGTRVVVHPKRRADVFDMFADGQTARVKGLHEDVDGRRYISVVFEADPASDMHEWYGRSFFYEPDEVELLT